MATRIRPLRPSVVESAGIKEDIAAHLAQARARSLALVEPLSERELVQPHSRIMSPLVWDLGHVANYEDLWLVRALGVASPTDPLLDDVYNAFEHPRWERPSLPLLSPAATRVYMRETRERALDVLASIDLDPSRRLVAAGFVYGMVAQHEHMHDETMLATINLRRDGAYPHPAPPPGAAIDLPEMVFVPGGTVRRRYLRRAVGVRQRETRARRRPAALLDRHDTGHERCLRLLCRGRRLRRRAALDANRVGVAPEQGRRAPWLLGA